MLPSCFAKEIVMATRMCHMVKMHNLSLYIQMKRDNLYAL